jgi:hypothetical protein
MAWGTVFSAFPGMKIVHQPGKANVPADAVSRLRQEVPPMISPLPDGSTPLRLNSDSEGLTNLYKELGDKFKNQVMEVATAHVLANQIGVSEEYVSVDLENSSKYFTTKSLNLLVHTSNSEVKKFMDMYNQDPHFGKVYQALRENYHPMNPPFSQYQVGDNGLLYFIDWAQKLRLCVPKDLQLEIIKENYDDVSNGAHAGYAKTYNRIASVYYWPKMSQAIKKYTDTCDICQKTKPRQHGPRGYLQPIPIPSQPFEVITMDFIVDLPQSNGYNAILVMVDKLTKYAHFIPCTTTINEQETTKLLHDHIWCHYGLPRQIISDRDA